MSDYPFGNHPAKVEGYKAFWERRNTDRPLIGFSRKSWLPLDEFRASAAWQSCEYLTPDMIDPEAFMDDQEGLLAEGNEIEDDIFRGASASQAVPWLCGMIGCDLRILPSSVLGVEQHRPWEELSDVRLDRTGPWYEKYLEFTETLVRRAGGRFPVSHGTLVGPSDLISMYRGHTQHVLDLLESPKETMNLLWRVTEIFEEITVEAWKRIPLFCDGYYDAQYQLWAPGSIVRMQEDASGVYSPDLYTKFLLPVDRYLATRFESPFMHLHSTSMFLLDRILEVEEIRCFEVNNDVGGPPIEKMIPYFRMIQEAERSLLIRGSFSPEELDMLAGALDPQGLYLYVMIEDRGEIERLKPVLGM